MRHWKTLQALLEGQNFSSWGEVRETAEPHTTLCDYDGQLPGDLRQRVRALRRLLNIRPERIKLHRTRRGFHLVIRWNREFTPLETVALQAILGSDPMREMLNLARVRAVPGGKLESRYWNILYSRKHEMQ